MQKMQKKTVMVMLAITLIGSAESVLAATATTTFQVDATVIASCNVSATNLAFGNYDTLSATPADATSTPSPSGVLSPPRTISASTRAAGRAPPSPPAS